MKNKVLFINLPSLPFEDILASFSGENVRPSPSACLWHSVSVISPEQSGSAWQSEHAGLRLAVQDVARYGNIEAFIEQVARKHVDFTPDILAGIPIFFNITPIFRNQYEDP
jgi:hypothetical protein